MPKVMVIMLVKAQSIFEYHVNAQFNKIPQLAMELQRERDGGMISQGIGWGVGQTYEPIGLSQMSLRKPLNLNYPFCPYTQSLIPSKNRMR